MSSGLRADFRLDLGDIVHLHPYIYEHNETRCGFCNALITPRRTKVPQTEVHCRQKCSHGVALGLHNGTTPQLAGASSRGPA